MKNMKKETKTYLELDDLHKLKISKVFKYKRLDDKKKEESHIVFEGSKMKYLIVEQEIIDL
jgi:hypothetical protein